MTSSNNGSGRIGPHKKTVKPRMCACCKVASPQPAPLTDDERPNPWVSTDGYVSHPDAPRGAGGPGFFRSRSQIDGPGSVSQTVPHPHSVTGDDLLMSEDDAASLQISAVTPTQSAGKKRNPPPKTVEKTHHIKKTVGTTQIDVKIKVLADVLNSGEVTSGAHTELNPGDVAPEFPGVSTDGAGKVTAEDGPIKYTGEMTIRTHYASGVKPEQDVAYGRGTKPDDITNGDISIGFHENCHINDYWTWLTTKDFPTFKGKVGDKSDVYLKKRDELDAAWEQYLADAADDTLAKTDEVGNPTKTQYDAQQNP